MSLFLFRPALANTVVQRAAAPRTFWTSHEKIIWWCLQPHFILEVSTKFCGTFHNILGRCQLASNSYWKRLSVVSRVKTQVGTFNEEKVLLEAFFKYCDNYREISLPPPLHTTHCMLQILAITPATSQYTICCSAGHCQPLHACSTTSQTGRIGNSISFEVGQQIWDL